LRDWSAT